ncbi:MAG: hypothetical protein D5S00_10070 [Tindallia sp. MSAO_Bac2]|nr:MAG: hypothetical protein D5S00_10070 [Tindallia sp. MSAO_Bac2]
MNYNEFMKAVDKQLSAMSETEKTEWIHNVARTTDINQRDAFLDSLTKEQEYLPAVSVSIEKEVEELEDWFRKVEEAEIYFECSGYEEYGEDYWDREYTYEYADIFEIGMTFERAFSIAEILLLNKKYQQAAVLYDLLCSVHFQAIDSDIGECSELEMEELVEKELVTLDLKKIALNMMYAKYQQTEGQQRTEELLRLLSWPMCKGAKIEEVFTVGPEELEGLDEFMEEWISFLKKRDGDLAGRLLSEACIYQGGISRLCEEAREVWKRHPVLYHNACQQLIDEKNYDECIKVGMEALNILPDKLTIRASIANLTATAAGDADIMYRCHEAAFYSESTLYHYLRLFEIPDYRNNIDRAAQYAGTLPEKPVWENDLVNKQMMINSISKDQKMILRFFSGDFDYIYEECKKDSRVLGWSVNTKGIFVPLFILLLDKNRKITKAGQQLINGIKFRTGFMGGCLQCFEDQFLSWKEKMKLSNEQHEAYIAWLKGETDKRVEAVVGGKHRQSYYKAAALITALGEALESNGMLNGRKTLIEHYIKLHSRKRAFKAEFGQFTE